MANNALDGQQKDEVRARGQAAAEQLSIMHGLSARLHADLGEDDFRQIAETNPERLLATCQRVA